MDLNIKFPRKIVKKQFGCDLTNLVLKLCNGVVAFMLKHSVGSLLKKESIKCVRTVFSLFQGHLP